MRPSVPSVLSLPLVLPLPLPTPRPQPAWSLSIPPRRRHLLSRATQQAVTERNAQPSRQAQSGPTEGDHLSGITGTPHNNMMPEQFVCVYAQRVCGAYCF